MSIQDLIRNKTTASTQPVVEETETETEVSTEAEIEQTETIDRKGWYKADRLQRYARANGVLVFPVNGYFIPEYDEDRELLAYYESQNLSYVYKID